MLIPKHGKRTDTRPQCDAPSEDEHRVRTWRYPEQEACQEKRREVVRPSHQLASVTFIGIGIHERRRITWRHNRLRISDLARFAPIPWV